MVALVNHAHSIMSSSLSKSSRANYDKVIIDYTTFTSSLRDSRSPLPLNIGNLILYMAHLSKLGYASSTITSKLSALNFCHQMANFPDISSHFLIKKFITGLSKLSPPSDIRVPITPSTLIRLCESAHLTIIGEYYVTMYKAIMSLSFFALLRPGEVTQAPNNILLEQVKIQSSQITITFVKFKHHQGPPIFPCVSIVVND